LDGEPARVPARGLRAPVGRRRTTRVGEPLPIDAWYADDGLPQQLVTASAQTADGYLWFGTEDGLSRFDGARFATFDRRNTPELGGGQIAALLASSDGSLLIGTDRDGLIQLAGGRFRRAWPASAPAPRVRDIAIDRDGAVWMATPDGLVRIARGVVRVFGPADGLATRSPRSIFIDPQGTLFVGSRGVVHRLRDGRFELAARLAAGSVVGLAADRDGALWVGTWGHGVFRLRGSSIERVAADRAEEAAFVSSLLVDRAGQVWVGTTYGLKQLDGGVLHSDPATAAVGRIDINSLLEDRNGSLWLGTTAGLRRLRPSAVARLGPEHGLSHGVVLAIARGRGDAVWIGTHGGGLNRVAGGRVERFGAEDGVPQQPITAILEDRAGVLWLGTGRGLYVRDRRRWRLVEEAGVAARAPIRTLLQDRHGAIWAGTDKGLVRLSGGRATIAIAPSDLPSWTVLALLEGRDGTIWVGTPHGLTSLRDGRSTTMTRDGLSDDMVQSLYGDAEGTLWVGTDRGLTRLAGGKATTYTPCEGLTRGSIDSGGRPIAVLAGLRGTSS
jgi:ligand-binding sensor domain-containing protein